MSLRDRRSLPVEAIPSPAGRLLRHRPARSDTSKGSMIQLFKKEAAHMRANFSDGSIIWGLLAMLAWLFLWFAPWHSWVETNLWLKVGTALAIFITPGAYLYLLINR